MEQPKGDDFIRYLARHFVNFGWFDRSPQRLHQNDGKGEYFSVSAFVVSVKDVWFIITAGHIIEGIKQALEAGQLLADFNITDSWAKGARFQPQIFNYMGAQKYCAFDEEKGLDYGAVRLDENTKARLLANNIEPIDERCWRHLMPKDCTAYMIVGTPSMYLKSKPVGQILQLNTTLARINLEKIDAPPDYMKTTGVRFYARRKDADSKIRAGDGTPLTNLDGMSGSPIFAFRQTDTGTSYYLLGIQSGTDASHNIIAANYFLPLGWVLDRMLEAPNTKP